MSLHHVASDATGSTIDITDRVRTPGYPATPYSVRDNAEEGSVALSDMTIDDPDGDLVITGHRRIYSYEDEAPAGDQLVHNGFTFGEKVIRGPNRQGAGRQWVVTLADVNTLLNRRVMNGTDANRPAETDTERMLALFGMTELNTVDDDSMVSLTAATTAMDAVDYRGQNVGEYIDDCRQASGKNCYVYYNETLGEYGLWYDFDYSTEFDSGCFLTTDEAQEVDYVTTFGYSIDRTYFNFDPSRVVSGGYMTGPFGTLYDQNLDTIDDFAAIDRAIPAENVKTLTAAQARMDRYLDDGATEELIIHTVMTKVPRSMVNAVKKGYLVDFKAEWGPGLTAYVKCRALYRHVTEITEDPIAGYEIEMDLSPIKVPVVPFAVLYRSQTADGGGPVGWNCSGDGTADGLTCNFGGSPDAPTVGPMDTTQGTFGGTIAPVEYIGITFSGTGTIDLEWGADVLNPIKVFGAAGGLTATVELLLNGSVVGTTALTTGGGSGPHDMTPITLTSFAVTAGDALTARMITSPPSTLYIDGGNLVIDGGGLM